jgi:transposase
MNEVLSRFGLSARRFCRLTGWNRSCLQYRPEGRDDATLRERLRSWAPLKPRWGAPILHDVLKAEGLVINHKRTERLYREEGLSLCGASAAGNCLRWPACHSPCPEDPMNAGRWTLSTTN